MIRLLLILLSLGFLATSPRRAAESPSRAVFADVCTTQVEVTYALMAPMLAVGVQVGLIGLPHVINAVAAGGDTGALV
jgi:hypothetical protein